MKSRLRKRYRLWKRGRVVRRIGREHFGPPTCNDKHCLCTDPRYWLVCDEFKTWDSKNARERWCIECGWDEQTHLAERALA